MRDPKRIRPLLDELAALWEQNPDMRLGQIIVSATRYTGPGKTRDPHAYEDEELLAMIQQMLNKDGAAKSSSPSLASSSAEFCCSFCGRSRRDVRQLISAAYVFICNDCVDLCSDIIAEAATEEDRARIRAALIQAIGDMPPDATSGQLADAVLARFELTVRR